MTKLHFYRPGYHSTTVTEKNENFRGNIVPAVNIAKDDSGYKLEVAVPGFSREEITINIEGEQLKIAGKSPNETVKDQQYSRQQFLKQDFELIYKLGESLNIEKMTAKLENGILNMSIPFSGKVKPAIKKIEIS